MTSLHHQYMTEKTSSRPGATTHHWPVLMKASTPLPSRSGCMPSTNPKNSTKAPSAPSAGQGLGLTRWYGWFGAPCVSAIGSAPLSGFVCGRTAEQGLGLRRLRFVERVRQRDGVDVVVAP